MANSRVSKDTARGTREALPRDNIFSLMHDGSSKSGQASPKGIQPLMHNGNSGGAKGGGDDRKTIGQLKKSG